MSEKNAVLITAFSTKVDMGKTTCHGNGFMYLLQGLSINQNVISCML